MKTSLVLAMIAAGLTLFNVYAFLSSGGIISIALAVLWGFISFKNIKAFLQTKE